MEEDDEVLARRLIAHRNGIREKIRKLSDKDLDEMLVNVTSIVVSKAGIYGEWYATDDLRDLLDDEIKRRRTWIDYTVIYHHSVVTYHHSATGNPDTPGKILITRIRVRSEDGLKLVLEKYYDKVIVVLQGHPKKRVYGFTVFITTGIRDYEDDVVK